MHNLIIEADGMKLTDALREYIEGKMQKLDRYSITNLKCLIKMDGRTGEDCVVEIIADDIFIGARGYDMYSTIVKAVNIMQIALEKEKTNAKHTNRTN